MQTSQLSATPRQSGLTSPRLWIQRLAVYESVNPLVLLREITFTRGLNIITGEDKNETGFGGHSVGKTSLCRVLRYGLGEARFATKQQEEAVRREFPHGWMTLELFIDGEPWAVARPFDRMAGKGRAARTESAESLFSSDFSDNEYLAYQNALAALPPPGLGISWGELLPWLTRDQECSFGSLTAWRSPQSESDSPSPQPKDASRIIRSVLGILRQGEAETAERAQQLKKDLKSAHDHVEQVKQTPELECGIVANRLYVSLGLPPPDRSLTPIEAEMAVGSKREELDVQIKAQEQAVESLMEELTGFNGMLENHQNRHDVLLGKVAPKQQVVQDNKPGDRSQRYHALKNQKQCNYTLRPLNSCQAYQDHLRLLELRLSKPTAQDFQNQVEYERHRAELWELEIAVKEHLEIIGYLAKDIETIKVELKKARLQLVHLCSKKELLEQMLEDFKTYHTKASASEANPELSEARRDQEKLQMEHEEADTRLKEIYQQKNATHKALEGLYSSLAKQAFGPIAAGKVYCKEKLLFSLSGTGLQEKTAIKALSIIVADITAMLSAAEGLSAHPGFLLHDGLRTFELAELLFYKLLAVIADKTLELGGSDEAPFQYIMTTVSNLKENLIPFVREELSEDNLFWTRRLRADFQQGDLFEFI